MLKCHCRDCQHATGGPFARAVLVPAKVFRLTKGTLRYHFVSRKKGEHKRGFCAECGGRVTGGESETPSGIIGILAGTLDDPSEFQPTMDIFISDAQPWDQMDPSLPKFKEYPLPLA